jgi:beta-glucosidase
MYDTENLYQRDKVVATPKEAVKLAVNAGIDMAVIPYSLSFVDHLIELDIESEVSVS